MPLPKELTTNRVRQESDELDPVFDTDAIDDAMEPYFDELVERLAAAYGLDTKQTDELADRICWRMELLPPQS
jgi:hypothetical protein